MTMATDFASHEWSRVNGELMSDDLQPYRPEAGGDWGPAYRPTPAPGWAPAGSPYLPAVVTDQRTNGALVAVAWVVTVLTFGYMLPWAIAATRGKSNAGAVAIINFLVGWTFIGWIISLVMACGSHQTAYAGGPPVNVIVAQQPRYPHLPPTVTGAIDGPPAGWYPAPDGSGNQQYWDGRAWMRNQPV